MATTLFRFLSIASLLLTSCSHTLCMECRRVNGFEPLYKAKITSVKDLGTGMCKIRYREINKREDK